ncbi:MAG: lysostaphin resistance A-like protein [Acidimicrobiales bacterium]
MSDRHPFGPPPSGPPTPGDPPPPVGVPASTSPPTGHRVRPWWGLGDVLLGLVVMVVASGLGLIVALPFTDLQAVQGGDPLPASATAIALLVQQAAQFGWAVGVSRWKGLGPRLDWRLDIRPVDPVVGVGTAIMALGLAGAVAAIVAALVDLDDAAEASNVAVLSDAEGSAWLPVVVAAVVLGAPLAEEFFFRGLVLRAIEKRAGPVVAVIGSTAVFTLPHYVGAGLDGTLVLFAAIGTVGLVLGTVTVVVGRLWPAIIAHMLFNGLGAAQALGAFDPAVS